MKRNPKVFVQISVLDQSLQINFNMGVCVSPSMAAQPKSSPRSPFGEYSKRGNIDVFAEQLRRKEFKRVIDKLYLRYDSNADGTLEENEVRMILCDALGRKSVNNDDFENILRLCKCEGTRRVRKQELYTLYEMWVAFTTSAKQQT